MRYRVLSTIQINLHPWKNPKFGEKIEYSQPGEVVDIDVPAGEFWSNWLMNAINKGWIESIPEELEGGAGNTPPPVRKFDDGEPVKKIDGDRKRGRPKKV